MNKINVTDFIRRDITRMDEYIPVPSLWDLSIKFNKRLDDVIKLDAGENQFGYGQSVSEALKNGKYLNYYPDPEYKELRRSIAKYVGVRLDNIMVGSGSDELLDLLLRLVLEPGDKVINCPPTFGIYSVLTELNRGITISIKRNEDYSLNIERIKNTVEDKVKVIIVCSPNNPTGTTSSANEIISLLSIGKLVIVDEAYFEFCGKTVVSLVEKYDNLIVLRTFSKWAGLAGLRLGYGVMSPYIVKQLLKVKPPYNVNLMAEYAGVAALKETKASKRTIQTIVKERKRLAEALRTVPYLRIYPSESNLLFMRVIGDLSKIRKYLESKCIAVRYYDSKVTGKAIRISIGRPEQNNKLIQALRTYEQT
ncbi:MAG TPA: histidinol-phosphate transaminase [Candidatus Wunengus sp. YC60]|uniref:histidinol-phosphate transaminase n=1 Tax=Candidatus Wunengus sp. YC60 TaxID=3367697 RepID=UPI004025CB19